MHPQRYAPVAAVLQALLQANLYVNVLKCCKTNLIWRVEPATFPNAPRETIETTKDALLIELHVCFPFEIGNDLNFDGLGDVIHPKFEVSRRDFPEKYVILII